jgi:hypothetical protein
MGGCGESPVHLLELLDDAGPRPLHCAGQNGQLETGGFVKKGGSGDAKLPIRGRGMEGIHSTRIAIYTLVPSTLSRLPKDSLLLNSSGLQRKGDQQRK